MNNADTQYLGYMEALLKEGDPRPTRNGIRHTLFGAQIGFDLRESFPLLTSKKVNFHAIVVELCWFLKGSGNIKYLLDHNVHIWDEWADSNGDLGPVYGKQWRSWEHITYNEDNAGNHGSGYHHDSIDQIANVVQNIITSPYDTRHIVTAWNPAEIDAMALPPCHCLFQFDVTTEGYLNCQLYQRSADWFLGVPFNIASYALLVEIIAAVTNLKPGVFVHTFGNYHLYDNHREQAKEQLSRTALFPLPRVYISGEIKPGFDLTKLEPDMFDLVGYQSHAAIKAPISV